MGGWMYPRASLDDLEERNLLHLLGLVSRVDQPEVWSLYRLRYSGLGKGKSTRNRPEGPEGGRGIALLFLDLGTRRDGW
jgi:hypothetical protein